MSRPAISIDHLLIGVVGGMQPDKLARSFKGDADGMSARFLYCWPPEPAYQPLADDVGEVEPEIVNAITRLVELAGPPGSEEFAPKSIPLSPQAVEGFEQFRQFVHRGKHALDGREREWWAKMPAHVLRLAGTLCLLNWAFVGGEESKAVDVCHIGSSIRLVAHYFWPHARACLCQIGLSDRHKEARRVLRWIRAHQRAEVSREDVRRDAIGRSLNAEETEELLRFLVRAGWLRETVHPSGPKGGKPARRWQVNPTLYATAETPQTPETTFTRRVSGVSGVSAAPKAVSETPKGSVPTPDYLGPPGDNPEDFLDIPPFLRRT
jgi:hypothetical protein